MMVCAQPRKMVNKSDNIDRRSSRMWVGIIAECKKGCEMDVTNLLSLISSSPALFSSLLLALSLLEEGLWDKDLVLGRDGPASRCVSMGR